MERDGGGRDTGTCSGGTEHRMNADMTTLQVTTPSLVSCMVERTKR